MPPVTRIPSDADLPKRASIVVIGGGIAGIATALELAERGLMLSSSRRAKPQQSNRVEIGDGAGRWAAIPAKFR